VVLDVQIYELLIPSTIAQTCHFYVISIQTKNKTQYWHVISLTRAGNIYFIPCLIAHFRKLCQAAHFIRHNYGPDDNIYPPIRKPKPLHTFSLQSLVFGLQSSVFSLQYSVFSLRSSVSRLPCLHDAVRQASPVFGFLSLISRLPSSVFRLRSPVFGLLTPDSRLPTIKNQTYNTFLTNLYSLSLVMPFSSDKIYVYLNK